MGAGVNCCLPIAAKDSNKLLERESECIENGFACFNELGKIEKDSKLSLNFL